MFGWSTPATYFGIYHTMDGQDYLGDFVDWGTNMGAGWRTLAIDEWEYLLKTRENATNLRGQATVNGVHGMILLPNDWTTPTGLTFTAMPNNWITNVYADADWTAMEEAGAVFLPVEGVRWEQALYSTDNGNYWSSTPAEDAQAAEYMLVKEETEILAGVERITDYGGRDNGISVRLAAFSVNPLDDAQAVKDLIEAIPAEITLDAACVNAIQAARDAYDALSEAAQGALDAADVKKLTDAEAALTALNQAEADKVVAKINNIPLPVELKLATRDSIQNARAAYDALTAEQKALVPAAEYQKLLDAEAALEAYAGGVPGGALAGKFTVNAAGDKIYFSKGNLQYTRESLDADWSTGTFKLAENQYDLIEENANPCCTDNYGDKTEVGLFGWGTWGEGKMPNLTTDMNSEYEWSTDFVGTLEGTDTWRTLTKDEWVYLLTNHDITLAKVHGVEGLLVAPDGIDLASKSMNDYSDVVISDESWTSMEEAGVLFLPATGKRGKVYGGNVKTEMRGYSVIYWSSTAAYPGAAYGVLYQPNGGIQNPSYDTYVNSGIGVRLVTVGSNPLDDAQAVKDMIDALPNPLEYPTSGAAIEAALNAYNKLSDAAKAALDEATVQHLIDAENEWAALVDKIEHKVSYIGKDGELKQEIIALLNIPEAPDVNGFEFARWDVKTTELYYEGVKIKAVYSPIITVNPAPYDTLVYNGLAQTLVVAAECKEGHVEYRIGEEAWSADLPQATNAGAYVIQYKLVREGHDDYLAGSVEAQIAKAPVAYTAPEAYDTLVYNYIMQDLVIAGQTQDGTFEYTLTPATDSWSTVLSQGMDAGTYDVYFRVIGDANHLDSVAPSPVAVSIAKRDIVVTAPAAYDTLVYNALAQTLAADGTADFGTLQYTLTPNDAESWKDEMAQAVNAGTCRVYFRVPGDSNHNDYPTDSIEASIAKAPLTVTADDAEVIYGEVAPEYTVAYSGWQGQDNAEVISGLVITSTYAQGSYAGEYAIVPSGATAANYTMIFVNGKLTVNKAVVKVEKAEAQIAKFADGHTPAVVLYQGKLDGVKLNDPLTHVTTAAFSSAEVGEHLTITLFYELTGDAALVANYDLQPTSEVFSEEGVIIEPFLPNNTDDPEDKESKVQEGIEVYAYGYCTGTGYSLNYHLNSGYPNQYKIEFEDSRFRNVAYEETEINGRDGVIDIEIPDSVHGDYKMTVTFRDSLYAWLESAPFEVTFHVNMSETYVRPLFNNTIVLVDTLDQFTDIQWYYRANDKDLWKPVPGANGHYLHVDGKLEGEYFVAAKYKGEPTFTCEQTDMQTLYGAETNKQAKVRAYPNPVVTTTTVSIENSENYEHNLRIVNLMGIEVENTTFEGNETVVDMDSYTTGNYTISVDGIVVKVLKK